MRLARADGKWTLEGAQGKTPKDSAIATLLDDLRDLRSADIAAEPAKDLAAWGLDHPDLRIALTDKEGSRSAVLAASTTASRTSYAPGARSSSRRATTCTRASTSSRRTSSRSRGRPLRPLTTEPSAEPEPGGPMDDGDDAEDGAD